MTREELIDQLVESFTVIGMGLGGTLGGLKGELQGVEHSQALMNTMKKHYKKKEVEKVKVPKHAVRVKDRAQLAKWVKGKGNVTSKIPVIGTPIKRFATKSALKSFVPSAHKGLRGKIANLTYNKYNAAYMPPSETSGRGAVLGSKYHHPEVIRHEVGHAMDLRGMTQKDVQRMGTPTWGHVFGSHKKSPRFAMEKRAWEKSGVSKKSKLRKHALGTYRSAHRMRRGALKGAAIGAGIGAVADIAYLATLDR